ncbi:MAG: adenylate/guanylate cyclase domain-containing protein [Actinomycetota bacterium]
MTPPRRIRKLFVNGGPLDTAVAAVVVSTGEGVRIEGPEGEPFLAAGELDGRHTDPVDVRHGPDLVARVFGPTAEVVAPIVGMAIDAALDRRALADEVLMLYRRMRILVELTEVLAAPEDPAEIVEHLVGETARALGDSSVSLHAADGELVCSVGDRSDISLPTVELDDAVIVGVDDEWQMLCAVPYESGFALIRTVRPTEYTAADASLLSTIVAIATPALLRAAAHRRQLDDADRRSRELESTVEQLRSELDMATTRILATVIFTDLVDSTATQARLGDAAWAKIIVAHNDHVRTSIERWGGTLVEFTGDGVFGWFDSPTRALGCLVDLRAAIESMGLQMRAGLHTGEVELRGAVTISGLTVNIAARLLGVSEAGEILTSAVTTSLVDRPAADFGVTRSFELKGVPGVWDAKPLLGR